MKQLILIEREELNALRAGATLSLTLNGGQVVTIGLEGRRRPGRGDGHGIYRGGRGDTLPPKVIEQIRKLKRAGLSDTKVAEQAKVARSTVYEYGRGYGPAKPRRRAPAEVDGMVGTMKALRKRGLTQRAIAKKLGLNLSVVQRRLARKGA